MNNRQIHTSSLWDWLVNSETFMRLLLIWQIYGQVVYQ